MFCLMDASASMTESLKDLAKRFFMLLHLFLTRHYREVHIVFIRHTSTAAVVDEEAFFRGTETGGSSSTAASEMGPTTLTTGAWFSLSRTDPKPELARTSSRTRDTTSIPWPTQSVPRSPATTRASPTSLVRYEIGRRSTTRR